MRIVCPQCGYSREIPANKIPARSSVATCPKCRFRFRFREDSPPAPSVVKSVSSSEPAYPPRPSRPSPAPSPEDMRPTPPPYISPRGVTYQPLPDDVWEPQNRPPRTLKPSARWLPDPEPGDEPQTFRQPESDRRDQGRQSGPWPDPPQRSWVRPEKSAASHVREEEQPRSWRPAPKPERGAAVNHETDAQDQPARNSDVQSQPGYEPGVGRLSDLKPDADLAEDFRPHSGSGDDRAPHDVRSDTGRPGAYAPVDDPKPAPAEASAAGLDEALFQTATFQAQEPGHARDNEPVRPLATTNVAEADASPVDDFSREASVSHAPSVSNEPVGLAASGASLSELGEALRGEEPSAAPAPASAPEPAAPPKPPEPDFWESARQAPRTAHEATTGDEPVRDIWARLQAMGGESATVAPAAGKEGKPPKETSNAPETAAPWDEFEHFGVAPAFLKTVRNVLFKPGDFFEALEPEAGRVRPLIFAVAVSELVVLFWMIWNFFGMGPNFSDLSHTEGFQGLGVRGLGSVALLGLAPVLMVGFSFLDAALSHFLLGLLRGVTRPFDATFRMLCYAGAPWLVAAAPLPLQYLLPVAVIWHMTLQAIGLKKQHKSGYSQVLASVLVKWSFYLMVFFAVYVLALRA